MVEKGPKTKLGNDVLQNLHACEIRLSRIGKIKETCMLLVKHVGVH